MMAKGDLTVEEVEAVFLTPKEIARVQRTLLGEYDVELVKDWMFLPSADFQEIHSKEQEIEVANFLLSKGFCIVAE